MKRFTALAATLVFAACIFLGGATAKADELNIESEEPVVIESIIEETVEEEPVVETENEIVAEENVEDTQEIEEVIIAEPESEEPEVEEITEELEIEEKEVYSAAEIAIRDFVRRMYINYLGREPEDAGFENWVSNLKAGTITASEAVQGFIFSREYTSVKQSNKDYVTAMYKTIFGRYPDNAGLKHWTTILDNGCTKKLVLAGFVNSIEFTQLAEKMGVVRGDYSSNEIVDKSPNVTAFVKRLYTYCLGRNPDKAGLADWTNQLIEGKLTGGEVAIGFFNSQEYLGKKAANEDFVATAYKVFFNRAGDKNGTQNWLSELYLGSSRDNILWGFIGSQEFITLCEQYSIKPSNGNNYYKTVSLPYSENEEKIWNYLKGRGLTDIAIAGLMGNFYAESGLKSNNVQDSYEKVIGMNDEEYTAAVDDGTYENFVHDQAGYGLCQFTYWTLKAALYDLAQESGTSIGDVETQLAYLCDSNTVIMKNINTKTTVFDAAAYFLLQYERPYDQSLAVQNKRAAYGFYYYNKYAGK